MMTPQVDANQRDDSGASAILVAAEVGRHQVMPALLARRGRRNWGKAGEIHGKKMKTWRTRWKPRKKSGKFGENDESLRKRGEHLGIMMEIHGKMIDIYGKKGWKSTETW